MPRKILPVALSEPEQVRLEQWIRAGSTPQQVVLRARIIVRAARGQSDDQIAIELKLQRRTVALWRHQVSEQGIGCMWEVAPGRGRKARHGQAEVSWIVEATLQTNPPRVQRTAANPREVRASPRRPAGRRSGATRSWKALAPSPARRSIKTIDTGDCPPTGNSTLPTMVGSCGRSSCGNGRI